MSLQWFCFCFMDDIDPALIAETRVSEKKIKLKMFA